MLAYDVAGATDDWMADGGPELLQYSDLVKLSESKVPDEELQKRLKHLLETPIVSNAGSRSGAQPRRPQVHGVGPVLRVGLWNLERGYNLDLIRASLSRPDELLTQATDDGKRPAAARQVKALSDADVLIFNEVDLGVSRSSYRDVASELAQDVGMNYAFGVEFLEVDPLLIGLQRPLGDEESARAWESTHPIDKERIRSLQGNAVLSRYPIVRARVVRLPECYDWYLNESARWHSSRRGAGGPLVGYLKKEYRGRFAAVEEWRSS
jgi:hypothetical protein